MRQIEGKDLEAIISGKGFTLMGDSNDKLYRLFHDGQKTQAYTKISHGKKTYSFKNSLLSEVKRQMGFRTNEELRKFLECSMTLPEYIELLKDRGMIRHQ